MQLSREWRAKIQAPGWESVKEALSVLAPVLGLTQERGSPLVTRQQALLQHEPQQVKRSRTLIRL